MTIERVTIDAADRLGPLVLAVPGGRRTLTPASRVVVEAIGRHASLFRGTGIDWGCGTGALAIAAARLPGVRRVIGLELEAEDLAWAARNVQANGVADKVTLVHADSYTPFDDRDGLALATLSGLVDFVVANPPAHPDGDGLGWRREVLRGGLQFLGPGAPALLQVSHQYGADRIRRLCDDVPGYGYEGVLHETPWVPFAESREDLPALLAQYADEERHGGLPYTFPDPEAPHAGHRDARATLERYRATGEGPLTRWQAHLFRRV